MIILTYLHGCSVFAKASQGRFRHRERISPRGEVEPNEGRVCVTQWRVSIRFGGLRICSRRDQRGNHASAAITTSLLSRSIRRLPVGGLLCEQSFACARNRGPSVISGQCNQFGEDRGLSCWSSASRAGALSRPSPSRRPDLYTGSTRSKASRILARRISAGTFARAQLLRRQATSHWSRVSSTTSCRASRRPPRPGVIPSCRLRPVFVTRPQPSGARRDGARGAAET